jgi:hypothetical protein
VEEVMRRPEVARKMDEFDAKFDALMS